MTNDFFLLKFFLYPPRDIWDILTKSYPAELISVNTPKNAKIISFEEVLKKKVSSFKSARQLELTKNLEYGMESGLTVSQ